MATPAKAGSGRRLDEGQSMTDRIAIFGYGSVGRATTARLLAEGRSVIVAQRRAPPDLPKEATFAPCDVLDRDAVVKAVSGAGQFVVATGFAYSGVVWREVWPKAMGNFVAACKATGARMVFIDNLSCTGPRQSRWSRPCRLSPLAGNLRRAQPRPVSGWTPRPRAKP
jgi:nucleoside-diphosphate-sugar epimerase